MQDFVAAEELGAVFGQEMPESDGFPVPSPSVIRLGEVS
jgi:hypothetical protein